MVDPRDVELADILVNYSVKMRPGDKVCLLTDSVVTRPLFLEVYKRIIMGGGYPYPHMELDPHIGFEGMDPIWMKYASDRQLKYFSRTRFNEMKAMNAYIRIGGGTEELTGLDPERIPLRRRVTRPMLTERLTKRWVATRYPTPNLAKTAGMKLKEFEDFFYGACLIDWDKQKQKQMTIKERLKGAKVIQILGAETDLKIGVAGRKLTLCYGKKNMPDGELYYAPLENFTNGCIKYTYPYNYNGQKIDGIFLRFEHGKVIYHNAVKNQKALTALLNTDPGSRVLGEAAFGTNEGIKKFTGETLFDEKIDGTVHITPGNAYPDSGGKNKSANHADIVKDLRPEFGGGEILVDGEVIQKNGKWTFI